MNVKEIKPGLIGRKIGMTQFFTEAGEGRGVTVIEVGPCVVTQVKTQEKEGYNAIQLGFGQTEFRRVNRASRGHFEKKKLKPFRKLKEFRVMDSGKYSLGQELTVAAFSPGDSIDVTGVSKGKGFQGVIKRHHKSGGPASHGSHFHRSTGSIGQRTWPGRVFKLMKLPGHMGDKQITVRNLKVLQVIPEKNYLIVDGAVPGGKSAYVSIKLKDAQAFEERTAAPKPEPEAKAEAAPAEEAKAETKQPEGAKEPGAKEPKAAADQQAGVEKGEEATKAEQPEGKPEKAEGKQKKKD